MTIITKSLKEKKINEITKTLSINLSTISISTEEQLIKMFGCGKEELLKNNYKYFTKCLEELGLIEITPKILSDETKQ